MNAGRVVDVDDVLFNTIGALVGMLVAGASSRWVIRAWRAAGLESMPPRALSLAGRTDGCTRGAGKNNPIMPGPATAALSRPTENDGSSTEAIAQNAAKAATNTSDTTIRRSRSGNESVPPRLPPRPARHHAGQDGRRRHQTGPHAHSRRLPGAHDRAGPVRALPDTGPGTPRGDNGRPRHSASRSRIRSRPRPPARSSMARSRGASEAGAGCRSGGVLLERRGRGSAGRTGSISPGRICGRSLRQMAHFPRNSGGRVYGGKSRGTGAGLVMCVVLLGSGGRAASGQDSRAPVRTALDLASGPLSVRVAEEGERLRESPQR